MDTRFAGWICAHGPGSTDTTRMRVRLIRKLAQKINGVDVSRQRVGDVIDLPRREAELLLAEGWASPAADRGSEGEPDKGTE